MSAENQNVSVPLISEDSQSIIDIVSLLNEGKKEKKKKKKPREEYLISTGKPRVVKKPSIVAETASDLIRLGYDTPIKINNYFVDKGRIVDEQQKKLYLLLVKSKVKLGKFILSDELANTPVNIHLLCYDFNSKIITNDWLWLSLLYNRQIDSDILAGTSLTGDKLFQKLCRSATIKNVQIVSNSFKCKNDVEKGYYQDYYSDFACVGMDGLNKDEITKFVGESEKYGFEYRGLSLIAIGKEGKCVIYNKDENLSDEEIFKRIEACKVISIEERKPKLKEKIIDIKNTVVKFIDCTVKPEDFCPAFLRTDENVRYKFFVTASVDYNTLFDHFDAEVNEKGKLMFYANSWYWDNTESWFEFLMVYAITTKSKLSEVGKKSLVDICDFYYKYQDMILGWKKNQLFLQKIFDDFYTSFSSKINYDKAKSLLGKIREYIGFRNWLMKDESYNQILNWVNNLYFCDYIRNQFRKDVMEIADSMNDCLSDLIDNRGSTDSLIGPFKKVAEMIYYCCPNEVKHSGFVPCFPMIFSAGGFLGYLFEKNEARDVLAINLKKINNQQDNINQQTTKIVNAFGDVFENMERYRQNVVRANVLNVAAKENVDFDNKELEEIVEKILVEFVKNPTYNAELNKGIYNAVKTGAGLDNLIIQQKNFRNTIENYVLRKKNEINQVKRENDKIDDEIENLRQKKKENEEFINKNSISNKRSRSRESSVDESSTSGKTEYDMALINKGEITNWAKFNKLIQTKKHDTELAKLYSAILYMSGLYKDFNSFDPKTKPKMSVIELMKKYPIGPALFELIVTESGFPNATINDIQNWLKKNPEVKRKNIDYTDEKRLQSKYFDLLGM